MRIHFLREIDKLKQQLLGMSAKVEEAVSDAMRAVETRDEAPARSVIQRESLTNAWDVDVEEECLKILALHQPVAADLRHLVAVLKINHDLERIGDLAVHIAEGALVLGALAPVTIPGQMGQMAVKSQQMLKRVLDGFVNEDVEAARQVRMADHELDDLNRETARILKGLIREQPGDLEQLIKLMHIARHLERIGDHAVNIAEDLIYQVEGKIVRHMDERQITG